MLNRLADWLDGRTGVLSGARGLMDGEVPGGARWRYSLGVALAAAFAVQVTTGVMLLFTYTPSAEMAWGSVYFVQERMTLGWFVRGMHHFGSQATIVLTGLHLLQVLVAGAYRAPREVNWWIGLGLLGLVLGLGATGYQLPWDQKGYWSTKIAANFTGGIPVLGPTLRKLVVGGTEFGNQTVSRFFALHVAVMPGLVVLLLTLHVLLFHKYGVTASKSASARGAGRYWPEQGFRDVAAAFVAVAAVATVVLVNHGAGLDAPADPSSADFPARPEWYFLPVFQMLKKFPGDKEYIGTVVIPGAVFLVLALMPFFDRVLPGKLAHALACAFVFTLAGGAGYFLFEAVTSDARDEGFQAARAKADVAAKRAIALANDPDVGVPPEGSGYVLLRDPLTHGRGVLDAKCLGCHVFGGKGLDKQAAPDLKGFGSRAWLRGLLENPSSDAYYGKVPGCDGMAEWKKGSKLTPKELAAVTDFVASFAAIPEDQTPVEWLNSPGVADHPGVKPWEVECGTCHAIEGLSEGGLRDAPGLFAWGSPRWTRRMILKPGAPDYYGFLEPAQQMPAFRGQLTDNDLTTVIRYLKDDYPGAPARAAAAPTFPVPARARP